jgi:CDP-diglyceride synthetase
LNITLNALLFAAAVFAGMLAAQEVGLRFGRRRLATEGESARTGLGAIDGAVFGLMGLLVAFAFHGAASRFDARRQLVIQEANDIGTAYLRVDLLPAAAQPKVRDLFRSYVDARLEVYRRLPDAAAAREALARAEGLQREIWSASLEAAREAPQATMLLLPAINAMIDVTTARTMALQTHPPLIVFAMLGFLALACALLAGYGMAGSRSRSVLHVLGFATILTVTVYVILDYEFPRVGIIRLDSADQLLVDVRSSMR